MIKRFDIAGLILRFARARRFVLMSAVLAGLLGNAVAPAQQLVNGSMDGVANYNIYNGIVPPGWYQTYPGGGSDLFAPTSTPSGHVWTASSDGGTFVHSYGCSPLYCLSEDVKQTITSLVPGQTYTIKFEQSISNKSTPLLMDTAGYWSVTFGGQTLDSDLMYLPPFGQAAPWVPQSLQFTATAVTQELTFLAATVDHTTYVHSSLGLDGVVICDCVGNNVFPWADIGYGLSGVYGEPCLVGMGPLTPSAPLTITLSVAKELVDSFFIIGYDAQYWPFKGGILVPDFPPNGIVIKIVTDVFGQATFNATWPSNIPGGFTFYVQAWVLDNAGPQGFSASNAITGTSQ